MTLKSANPSIGNLPSPMLVMVMGLPGSGKTFFAKSLTQKIGGVHFNSDIIRKRQPASPAGRPQQVGYSARQKSEVYQTMYDKVCSALIKHHRVVVDATFSLQRYRDPYLRFAEKHQIPVKVILVSADESTIFQRVQHQRPDSDADFQVYQQIKREFEPIEMDFLPLPSDQDPINKLIEEGITYLVKP